MQRIWRAVVVAVLASASVLLLVQPAAADADTQNPQLGALTISRTRVPATGGTVHVEVHLVDEGSGVSDAPSISFGWWYGGDVLPRLPMTLVSGTATDGVWALDYPFTTEMPLGRSLPVLVVADRAGNTATGYYPAQTVGFGTSTAPQSGSSTQLPGRALRIAWTAPADDGGSTVTGYRVSLSTSTVATLDASTTSIDYPAASWTGYGALEFTVVALNGAGPSAPLTVGPVRVAGTPPSAMLGVQATSLDSALDLSWTAPEDSGGPWPLEYVVDVQPGTHGCVTRSLSCRVQDLDPHVAYTATVRARNPIGAGGVAATTARPTGTLEGPWFVDAQGGLGTVDVTWSLRGDGNPMERWRVVLTPLDGPAVAVEVPGDARSAHFADLPWGTWYRVSISGEGDGAVLPARITGSVGVTRWDPPLQPITVPAPESVPPPVRPPPAAAPIRPAPVRPAPGIVRVVRTKGASQRSVALAWRAPDSSVTAYEVRLLLRGQVVRQRVGTRVVEARRTVPADRRVVRFTRLRPATAYTFQVRARGATGSGPWSSHRVRTDR